MSNENRVDVQYLKETTIIEPYPQTLLRTVDGIICVTNTEHSVRIYINTSQNINDAELLVEVLQNRVVATRINGFVSTCTIYEQGTHVCVEYGEEQTCILVPTNYWK
jgi:hypothetical protein